MSNPFAGIAHAIQGGAVQWINPVAFANRALEPTVTTLVTAATGRALKTSISLLKTTPITKRINTQFRVEMFNLFNHLNLANPGPEQLGDDAFGTSSFGLIGSIIAAGNYALGIGPGELFNVQLALKIIF